MASIPSELAASSVASLSGKFLVMLTPAAPDQIEATLDCLGRAFVGQHIAVSISDLSHEGLESLQHRFPEMHPVSTAPEVASGSGWVLTAADFFNLYKSAKEQDASRCLLLGPDSHTLTAEALKGLEAAVAAGADLVVPRYDAGPPRGTGKFGFALSSHSRHLWRNPTVSTGGGLGNVNPHGCQIGHHRSKVYSREAE